MFIYNFVPYCYFFALYEDFDLNTLVTIVNNYDVLDGFAHSAGWTAHINNHQEVSRILYYYQPPFNFISEDSYMYYPLQMNLQYVPKNNYNSIPSFFNMNWYTRDMVPSPPTELAFRAGHGKLPLDVATQGAYLRTYKSYYDPNFMYDDTLLKGNIYKPDNFVMRYL